MWSKTQGCPFIRSYASFRGSFGRHGNIDMFRAFLAFNKLRNEIAHNLPAETLTPKLDAFLLCICSGKAEMGAEDCFGNWKE